LAPAFTGPGFCGSLLWWQMLQSPESNGAWYDTAFSPDGNGATRLLLTLATTGCTARGALCASFLFGLWALASNTADSITTNTPAFLTPFLSQA